MELLLRNEGLSVASDLSINFHRYDLRATITAASITFLAGTDRRTLVLPSSRATVTRAQSGLRALLHDVPLAVALHLSSDDYSQHLDISVAVSNTSPGPLHLFSCSLEIDVSTASGTRVPIERIGWFRNGWQSWSYAGAIDASRPFFPHPTRPFIYGLKEDPEVPPQLAPYVSDAFVALSLGDAAIGVGARSQIHFQQLRLQLIEDRFKIFPTIDLDDEILAPGASHPAGSWQIEGAGTRSILAHLWGSRIKHRCRILTSPNMQSGIPLGAATVSTGEPQTEKREARDSRTLLGWCSWYDRGRRISFDYIRRTLDRITSDPALSPLEVILVDDGYEDHVGDWLAYSKRFGGSLEALASYITSAGKIPGIWLAPFIAQARSQLLKEHPDWFVQHRGGPRALGWNPHWRASFYPLDPANEEVLEFLREVFSTLRSYGFRVFKLDYLFSAALRRPRLPGDPCRFNVFRNALLVIRNAVGEDSVLLGSGAPIAPAIGILDAVRVSTDVGSCWNTTGLLKIVSGDSELVGIVPAIRNTLARALFMRPWFLVDPDCLLLRKRKRGASRNELDLLGKLIMLNGQVIFIGDDITRWTPDDSNRFSELLALRCKKLTPLDAADRAEPVWAVASGDAMGRVLAAAFNLGGDRDMLSVPVLLLQDWLPITSVQPITGNQASIDNERLSVFPVKARTCSLIQLERKDKG